MVVIYRIRHGIGGETAPYLNAPNVIRDHLDDLTSPIDGRPQTSKRAYYRQLRQAGCEINDTAMVKDSNRPSYDTSGIAGEVANAMRELRRDFKGQ